MTTYLVNFENHEGLLSPDMWREFKAEDQQSAVAMALASRVRAGHFPERAYVAIGNDRHPNGAPIVVQGFNLEYGKQD